MSNRQRRVQDASHALKMEGVSVSLKVNLWTGAVTSRDVIFCPHCRSTVELTCNVGTGMKAMRCQNPSCLKWFTCQKYKSGRCVSARQSA